MPCDLSETQLHAYLDGELDAVSSATFEKHLESCPQCAKTLAAEEALRQTLASSQLYEPAPLDLRNKIRANLPKALSARASQFQAWRWVAIAASLLFAALLGRELLTVVRGQSEGSALASAAVDAHLRSLQPGHLTDVESTDQHTVKPWFYGRIDFAPSVRDFGGDGFPLLGGRLDVLTGKTVAVIVYGRRKHLINVFVMKPQTSQVPPESGERQGYRWLSWQKSGLQYLAVADTGTIDLQQLRDLILKE